MISRRWLDQNGCEMHRKEKTHMQSVQNYYFSLSNLWLFCRRLSVWRLCLSGTPVSSGAKNALKSMEIKTNARASFTITLLVHWIQLLSLTAQNSKDGKGLKPGTWPTFSSFDAIYSKNSQRFKVDSFSCQNSVQVVFLGYENVVGFELSTKFRFSTSSDLQTAKLLW